jgi:hypothetical protein
MKIKEQLQIIEGSFDTVIKKAEQLQKTNDSQLSQNKIIFP